jgi:hypothetical protein
LNLAKRTTLSKETILPPIEKGFIVGRETSKPEKHEPERVVQSLGSPGGKSNYNNMITVKKSETADTRTCDFANVSKETLIKSSLQHIGDVGKGLAFFQSLLTKAAAEHDYDKLSDIDTFHADFVGGFESTVWWDAHRKMHRHHLAQEDGVPENVNLVDVLEYITDCVMAGMARSGEVYDLQMTPELLQKAFENTVKLLKNEVQVEGAESKTSDSVLKNNISLVKRYKRDAKMIKHDNMFCIMQDNELLGEGHTVDHAWAHAARYIWATI